MPIRPKDIAERVARLRLPQSRLAELARLDQNTVGRALAQNSDPLSSTIEKIERALVAEERDLLAHLHALHGSPPIAPAQPTAPPHRGAAPRRKARAA